MIITANKNSVVRFIRSGFGIRQEWRTMKNSRGRKEVIERLRGGASLATRRDTHLLLGSPVLLVDAEVEGLQKYARMADTTLVEIGAAYGGSSLLFLLAKKDKTRLYSIDPFVIDSMDSFQATRDLCYGKVTAALADLGKAERISSWTLMPEYSFDAVKKWERSIDVIFIDGDHTYEVVRQDFEQWLPFVRSGGHILFHDSCLVDGTPEGKYNKGWPGPTRLVKEIANNSKDVLFVETISSITVFKKK